MRLSSLMKNAGIAALAAAMAITALPAAAQGGFRGRGAERGGGEQSRGSNSGGYRGNRDAGTASAQARSSSGSSFRSSRGNSTSAPVQARGNDAPINQVRARSRQLGNGGEQVTRGGDRGRGYRGSASVAPQNQAATPQVAQNGQGRSAQGRERDRSGRTGDRYQARTNSGVAIRNGSNGDRSGNSRNGNDRRGDGDYRSGNYRSGNSSASSRYANNNRSTYNNGRSTYNNGRYASNSDRNRDYRRWDNRSWRDDRRYDWYGYRSSNRSVYRLGSYYAPYRNYSYSRLGVGFYLDSLFFGSRYLISDPFRYRLPPVYGPYRWVRYYDDALLVDTYSGEVVDVIYSFFW